MNPEPALLYQPSRPFRRVTLEMSLKPFYDDSPETRARVLDQLFRQWMPLCHRADSVSVMLWIADGSEILDYRGYLDAVFEWARWLGSANHWQLDRPAETKAETGDEQGLGFHSRNLDPEGRGLHRRSYPYRCETPEFTYRWLKLLIEDAKGIGGRLTGKPIEIGFTFDPGPEFSVSEFKYHRHPELCGTGALFGKSFVSCTARLHADDVSYAGFPRGIAEGTSIGTFLGRQVSALQQDLGFDFIWFSNGFGFGGETWSMHGVLFDGSEFTPTAAETQRRDILSFWKDFRRACPSLPIRTRGTNLSTGVDLASDGVPLADIYRKVKNLEAPVNSPWAALDGDFGLELAGWMSHIADLPGEDFTFRFYAHDPWWMNSPWLDRFERRPHDIFLPLSVSRLDETGAVRTTENLSILTVDNSHGQMPDVVAAEVSAHLIRTREMAPNGIAPLLWIYPFQEYHDAVFSELSAGKKLDLVYFGDWFVRGMINNGVPLNMVASSGNFLSEFTAHPERFAATVLITPVPAPESKLRSALLRHASNGGKVLLYGPIESEDTELLDLFNLEITTGLEGDFILELPPTLQQFFEGERVPNQLYHPSVFSAGALCHSFRTTAAPNSVQMAQGRQAGASRALAAVTSPANWSGGAIGWLRGGISCDETKSHGLLPSALDKTRYFHGESLARAVLAHLGFSIRFNREQAESRVPVLTAARSGNAWTLGAYNPDDVPVEFRLPHGAPIPLGQRVEIRNDTTYLSPPAAWMAECRLFVEQAEASTVYVQEVPSIMAGVRRRWLVKGLRNARLRFFPEVGTEEKVQFLLDPIFPYFTGDFRNARCVESPAGLYLELENLSGSLLISR